VTNPGLYKIEHPLTGELADICSPVRQFFDSRFSTGLRNVQSRYRQSAPALAVPPVERAEADPGTVGTAADWLLRFLLYPSPSLELAARGALWCGTRPRKPGLGMLAALEELAQTLGMTRADFRQGRRFFDGPVEGNSAEPGHLARACWALALLTEVSRRPVVASRGPLARFGDRRPPLAELLALASRPRLTSSASSGPSSRRCCFPRWRTGRGCGRSAPRSPGLP